MQHTHDTDEQFSKMVAPGQPVAVVDAAQDVMSNGRELSEMLKRAAALASSMGISLDAWMKDAWSAYVDARPGLREQLEDMQLIAQLMELRQHGRIGQA